VDIGSSIDVIRRGRCLPPFEGAKDGSTSGWVTPARIKTQNGGPLAESLSAGIFEAPGRICR
jgi:hypothetical protein